MVYKAKKQDGTLVALKVLKSELTNTGHFERSGTGSGTSRPSTKASRPTTWSAACSTRMRAPYLNKDGFSFTIYRKSIFSGIRRSARHARLCRSVSLHQIRVIKGEGSEILIRRIERTIYRKKS